MSFLFLTITIMVLGFYALVKGLTSFICRPVEHIPINNTSNEPQKIIIKDAQLNTDNIIEWNGEELKEFEFRPRTFQEFIGQEDAKERAKTILRKAKKQMKCHFLVDGIKGHGKTTFVNLVANSLNAHVIERIGKQIDEDSIIDIINEINQSPSEFVMLFIDEIDTMNWKIVKIFNPIIESFKINGKRIKPFIFAGATINKHILIKNNPDTLNRIPSHIKFIRYNVNEIASIVIQYRLKMYPNENTSFKNAIETIARNCKFNPRTAIMLLEDYIVEKNIEKVLNNCRIVKDGLTKVDIEILKALKNSTKAMGANALGMRVGLSQNEYLREYEPFLVEYDYINRVPSRVISEKGKKLLEEINE